MIKHILLFSTTILLLSCEKEALDSEEIGNTQSNEKSIEIPEAYPYSSGEIVKIDQSDGTEIILERFGSEYVMSGDIILTSEQVNTIKKNASLEKGAAISSFNKYWLKSKVYYTISPDLPNPNRVISAINHYRANVPSIEFIEKTLSSQINYIEFVPGDGCSSKLGMIGGRQTIELGPRCSMGTVIHEIGHALGLFHEQSRADRDEHIIINWFNIRLGKRRQFQKYQVQDRPGFDFGDFDFNSIMLYPSVIRNTDFVILESVPAITRLDGTTYNHNRRRLSEGDIAILNHIYGGPYTKLIIQQEGDYESDGYDIESTYYVEFYSDKNYTTKYYLPDNLKLNYYLENDRPSGLRRYLREKTLLKGNYRYYISTEYSRCYYDYGEPDPNCEDNSVSVGQGFGYID